MGLPFCGKDIQRDINTKCILCNSQEQDVGDCPAALSTAGGGGGGVELAFLCVVFWFISVQSRHVLCVSWRIC